MKGREYMKKRIGAASAAVLVICALLTFGACGEKNNGTVTENMGSTNMISEKSSEMMSNVSEMITDVSEKISEKISEMTPDVSDGTIPDTTN